MAVCGGNDGQQIQNKFYLVTFKKQSSTPHISEMPPMLQAREEFQLLMGPDSKLYAIGGYN